MKSVSMPLTVMLRLSVRPKYWWKLNIKCMKGDQSLVISVLRRLISSNIFTWSTGIKNILALVNNLDIWDLNLMFNITYKNFNDIILSQQTSRDL